MKVLIACEESQAVCTAFRQRGHEAYSCDLQECSGGHPEWHVMGDALDALARIGGGVTTMDNMFHPIEKWDLVIAHPPCTYLSNAGAARLYPHKGQLNKDRYIEGLKGKEFFMRFWWYGRLGVGPIAIQNPVQTRIFDIPTPTQVIQPYQFGDPYSKRTHLWLFGVPNLKYTNVVQPICSWVSGGSKDNNGNPRKNKGTTLRSSVSRSKTFPGIAKAMAEQWG